MEVGFVSGHTFRCAVSAAEWVAPSGAAAKHRLFTFGNARTALPASVRPRALCSRELRRQIPIERPVPSLKMNFIFKMPDAILTAYVAEAHR